ncbi:BTAD domain-containing putative transcriptional regulator [Mycolicibacterium agri]|uniref:BTAD domain-containing putative transcriptional regulator n=1 Tax=Mycolicibacterium agri TaxID=36811 RepID=UPI0026A0C585
MELGVFGPLQVRKDGAAVAVPGAKPRAILTMLGLHGGSAVSADLLLELLWGNDPPRTAAKALQTHISSLRRALGDGVVLTAGAGWTLAGADVDASCYKTAAQRGRAAVAEGNTNQAVAHFEEALRLWRGVPELPDGQRGLSEKTRWIEAHAALVEDRADALLATGRAAEIIGELEAAIADAPLRERRWGQLMLALYRAGRQGEALGAYQRARSLLADQLGVDPGPELRRLEAAIVSQDPALDMPVAQRVSTTTRAVTFLLTDIEGSTAAWEADADAMALALARHDELVEHVVTSRGGRLIKTRGEGDATFSVFDRPSAAAAAAIELQDAIAHEPWTLTEPVVLEVGRDNKISTIFMLDTDDVEAAFKELETRYIAGEAAAHSQMWTVVLQAEEALVGRRPLSPTTPDWVNADHRRGIGFAPGDLTPYVRVTRDQNEGSAYIEAVHRLNDCGAVFTNVIKATAPEAFDAEWRFIELMQAKGELISRVEVFDEEDLDSALAKFDELQAQNA